MSPMECQPDLNRFATLAEVEELVACARREDLGPEARDLTSELFIPGELRGVARFVARQAGCLAGAALLPVVMRHYDAGVTLEAPLADGSELAAGSSIATIAGPMRSLLALERVALNFLTHLSGIASLTRRYVHLAAGHRAVICDTRKTLPGLRHLEKYAVVCGGGISHRMGLYDAVLIKDNHLAHLGLEDLGQAVRLAVERAKTARPAPAFVEVEVDSLAQLERVLASGADMVLLDNMAPEQMVQAVQRRDRIRPGVLLEASGGINLQTVRAIAESGVDRISIGALTHSAPALDIGLDVV